MPIFYFLKITRNREEYCSFESCNKQVTNTKNHTKNQGIKMKFKFKLHTKKNIYTEQCKIKIIYVYEKLKIENFSFLKKNS